MWKIIQELLPWLFVVLIFSQYVIPIIFNQETWWLFKKKKSTKVNELKNSLQDEVEKTETVVKETKEKVNQVKEKVDENLKSAEDLKNKTDKLI